MGAKDTQTRVASRDGALIGTLTGSAYRCRLEGCTGTRLGVRWPDRSITYPCSRGMMWDAGKGMWRIE
jgi:hypothetical protein